MLGEAIGSQALGHAGLRRLASEHGGARPAAVRGEFIQPSEVTDPVTRADADRPVRPTRP